MLYASLVYSVTNLQCFLELQLKMSRMFFETQCRVLVVQLTYQMKRMSYIIRA